MPDDVKDKLDAAKKALSGAKDFQKSAGGPLPKSDQKPADKKAAAPKPASGGVMDGLKKMAADQTKQADDIAGGLKAKKDNVDAYKKATDADAPMPKMHKGGKVQKDGPHNLKKGEVVLTQKDAKKMGVKDGMKEDKEEKSEK